MLKRKKLEKGRKKRRQNLLFWGYISLGKDQIVTTNTMSFLDVSSTYLERTIQSWLERSGALS
jgi:hypothetical protein